MVVLAHVCANLCFGVRSTGYFPRHANVPESQPTKHDARREMGTQAITKTVKTRLFTGIGAAGYDAPENTQCSQMLPLNVSPTRYKSERTSGR